MKRILALCFIFSVFVARGGNPTYQEIPNMIATNSLVSYTNRIILMGSTNIGNLSVNIANTGPQQIVIGTNIVGKNPGGVGSDIAMPQNSGIFWESAAGNDGVYYNSHHDGTFRGRVTLNGTGGIDLLFTGGGLQIGNHGADHAPVFLTEDVEPFSTLLYGFSKPLNFDILAWSNNVIVQPAGNGPSIRGRAESTNGPIWGLLEFFSIAPQFTTTGNHEPNVPGFIAFRTRTNGLEIPANRDLVVTNGTIKMMGGAGSAMKFSKNGDPTISSASFDWTMYENNSGDFILEHTVTGPSPFQIAAFDNTMYLQLGVSAPLQLFGSRVEVNSKLQIDTTVSSVGGKPNAVTIGGSPFIFVNNTTANLECYFSSTSVAYSVSKNGAAVYPSLVGDDYLILQPTNSVSITYVATPPTVFTNAW